MTTSSAAEVPIPLESATPKLPLVTLVLAMVAAVLLSSVAVGGALVYMVRSGRLPLQRGGASVTPVVAPAALQASHSMVLEPMVANLADVGGTAYLKMALTLRIVDDPVKKVAPTKDEKPAKGANEADAAVRDTVLTVVGRQSAEQLLSPDGKEKLKVQLKAALAEHNPDLKVVDLYFVDFLVQR